MYDFLIDHAIKNVWCTPDQDRQVIIEPAKISPMDGYLNTAVVLNRNITLPIQNTDRFHIFQIGQLYTALIGLPDSLNVWTTLASACSSNKLMVDIYADNGLQLPRVHVWYMTTTDNNLILAVKEQSTINIDINNNPIYFRVYSNAFFASKESDPLNDFIRVEGGIMNTTNDILALQVKYNAMALLPGATYGFVNGKKVAGIDLISTKLGDVAEYLHDSSIYKVVDLPVSSLQTFTSILDNKSKYLLHYLGSNDGTIDYLDDIDIFLIKPTNSNVHVGLYYNKNIVDAVRMVTHKDYSIPVSYLSEYLNTISGLNDISQLVVRLHIRKSGYNRTLMLENNRIEELYKLPDNKLMGALIGINSDVSNWTAANLENSPYVKIMGSNYTGITRTLVEDAYGYNLISKLIGDTPTTIDNSSGLSLANLAYGLIPNSVVYEYDLNGILLGWHQHLYGTKYIASNISCTQVEAITGSYNLDTSLDEVYGASSVVLDPNLEYRYYMCPIINGTPNNIWVDVTNTNSYVINNNVLKWAVSSTDYYTLVRSNKFILTYDLMLIADNGLVNFSLANNQLRNNQSSMWVMQVPMGELDIFLNGYSLIEGIDYIFRFPEVMIINKAFLQNVLTQQQKITIRYTGFCNSDFTSDVKPDTGYIEYGLLSHNNKFDIRDDEVLRIVVGGKYYNRSQLKFAESDTGVTVPNVSNGLPYSVKDIVVPFRGIGTMDTYAARFKSEIIDKAVASYMTSYYPQPVTNGLNVIQSLYKLYSPFCCKIIFDLMNGTISDPRLMQQYSDMDMISICEPYIYLLDFDPIKTQAGGTLINSDYVDIQPHYLNNVISLNIYQYQFIDRVIKYYMNGLVSLNTFVTISQT